MSDDESGRVASVSAALSGVVGVLTALIVGVGAGLLAGTVLAVLGGAAVGEGARRVAGEDPRRASGSVAVALGTLALAGSVGLGVATAPVVAIALAIGLLVVTIDAGPGFSWEGTREVNYVLRRSAVALAAIAVLVGVVHSGLPAAAAAVLVDGWVAVVSVGALTGLLVLCVELLAVVLGFGVVVPVVERWAPPGYRSDVERLERFRTSPLEVPVTVYAVLLGGGLLSTSGTVRGVFASVLDLLAPIGPLLAGGLTSPVVHAVPAITLVAFGLLLAVELVRRVAVFWLSPNPPRSAGRAAGGVVAAVLVVAVAAVPAVGAALTGPLTPELVDAVGAASLLMAGTVLAMAGLWITLAATLLLSETRFVRSERAGFTLGSALLVLATVVAALTGASAPTTFLGVAGAILVFDLGEHATDLGGAVAAGSETRRAEVVHASASGLVAALAVVLATVGAYVVVPLLPRLRVGGGPSWAPTAALGLALVAVVAYLRLLGVREGTGE